MPARRGETIWPIGTGPTKREGTRCKQQRTVIIHFLLQKHAMHQSNTIASRKPGNQRRLTRPSKNKPRYL